MLSRQVMTATENGLSVGKLGDRIGNNELNLILEFIRKARVELESKNYIECAANISRAELLYYNALYSTTRVWRYNVYGGSLFIYAVGFLFAVIFLYIYIVRHQFFSFLS